MSGTGDADEAGGAPRRLLYTIRRTITTTIAAHSQYVSRCRRRKAPILGPKLMPMTITTPAQIAVETATLAANNR